MDTKGKIEVMIAYNDGLYVEYRDKSISCTTWRDSKSPLWDWGYKEYRIKPKPKVKMWQWVVLNSSTGRPETTVSYYTSEKHLKKSIMRKAIQRADWTMIEVADE